MPAAIEPGERLVCAVLAAQVEALRDRIHATSVVEFLWHASDTLARLAGLVTEQSRRATTPDADLAAACATAVANVAQMNDTLENLAFVQAQGQDYASQMADCVVTALQRIAAPNAKPETRLSPNDLVALYVCEDQHRVHETVARARSLQVDFNLKRESPSTAKAESAIAAT
jgi:hypothetical protein